MRGNMKLTIAGKTLHRYPEDWRETGSDWVDILEDFPQFLEKERQQIARKKLGLTMKQMNQLVLATQSARLELLRMETAQEAGEEYTPAEIDMPDISVESQMSKDDAVAAFDVQHYLKDWGTVDETGGSALLKDGEGKTLLCNDSNKQKMTEPLFHQVAALIEAHRTSRQPTEDEVKNSSESSGTTSTVIESPGV